MLQHPEYPNFQALDIDTVELVKPHLKTAQPLVCELSLANLLIYKRSDKVKFTFINGNLCFLLSPLNEAPFFLEPLGSHQLKATVDLCLRHVGRISRASESLVNSLGLKKYKISCLRDHFDYVYLTKELAQLKGKKFDGKRNHIKNFSARHPDYQFVHLEKTMGSDALKIFEQWAKTRQEPLSVTKDALGAAFDYFDELKIAGGALIIANQFKGFTLGSQLNHDTADLHFSLADPHLRGISQVILWEACNKTFHKAKYVNLEQDLGIPGLRKAKLSYYPFKLIKKFELS